MRRCPHKNQSIGYGDTAGRLGALVVGLTLAVGMFLSSSQLYAQPKDVKEFCKSIVDKTQWLRIGVVRIQHVVGGTDATNVYPNDRVSYRAKFGGLRQMQSSSAEDFAEEARIQAAKDKTGLGSSIRHWEKGTKVTIHKIKAKKTEIQWDITEEGGSKSRLRFKFDKDVDSYNLGTVKKMYAFTFADSEEELGDPIIEIELGMSVEEVIALKGKPNTRVSLGKKTIMTYEDIKIIFVDDKLADVQ